MTNPGDPDETRGSADDEMLIRDLLGGDERAFRSLYARHTPRLYALVLRILASREDAEDVVQEAWIRAVRSLAEFRGDAQFYTWLAAIAMNRIGDRLRRKKRWVFDDTALEKLPASDGADDSGIDMERALALLPAGCRSVLVLHDIEGFTHEEIASQLGVTTGTSKSQLFRARRALRRMLQNVEEKTDATA